MVSFKEVWPWNKFERCVVLNTIRLRAELNFFITEILEVFYFLSDFFFVAENFLNGFLRSFGPK